MEPISAALLAAIAAGLTSGGTDAVSSAVVDAYGALKAALHRHFGKDSRIATAVDDLETQPASKARQAVVIEEVEASGAARDSELVAVANELLRVLADTPVGAQHLQQATGNYIAQADRGGTANVRVGGSHPGASPDSP